MSSDFGKNDKGEHCVYRDILSKRIPEIDGLRGLAIFGVLAIHLFGEGINYEQSHWLAAYAAEFSKIGVAGVDLFFVISGFLIGGILIDNRNSTNYFKTFYLRRIFRIFPLYYTVLIIFFLLSHAAARQIINTPPWLLGFTFSSKWYLFFAQNFPIANTGSSTLILAPTWSLAVEEQFYLILPLIIYFVSRKHLPLLVILMIWAAPVFRSAVWYQTSSIMAARVLMPDCLDGLMTGVLIAILLRSAKVSKFIEKYRLRLLTFCLIFFWWLSNIIVYCLIKISPKLAENQLGFGYTFSISFNAGLLLILAVTSKPESIVSRIFSNKILKKIGELSYAVYLFHMGVYLFIHWQMGLIEKPPFGLIWLIEIGITLALTFLLAQLSWQYFEKPLINYGHTFKYKI